MPQIQILPPNLCNKIAAGEVIERPSSIVKELIENSIDANSHSISINILKSGKKLIKVSDNGYGMSKEDSILCFQRYATSKIKTEDDLFDIKTMGFRGEALSSIAAVSKVKLTTSYSSEKIGTTLEVIDGQIKEIKDCSTIGTSIEVRDIFYNIPARLKFLKSDSVENYHIIDAVTNAAISHYNISFLLTIDQSEILNLPNASTVKERLLQIYGKDFVDGLIEVSSGDTEINGLIFLGKIHNIRNTRSHQFIFVNKRPIKDQTISQAIYKGFEDLVLPKGKHPLFFIFLEIQPNIVDFNVHPTKKEVRFQNKSLIFNFVFILVKNKIKDQIQEIEINNPNQSEDNRNEAYPYTYEFLNTIYKDNLSSNVPHSFRNYTEPSQSSFSQYNNYNPFLHIGESFIAVKTEEGLTLIDYHAAHERINYEKFLDNSKILIHRLLFPVQIKLQPSYYNIIRDNSIFLNEFGLEIEDFGHNTILLRSLPEELKDTDINILINDIAVSLLNREIKNIETLEEKRKVFAAKLACYSSIRGKEFLTQEEVTNLITHLDKSKNPLHCPHGRPTKIKLSIEEVKKMFKK